MTRRWLALWLLAVMSSGHTQETAIRLYAAGSLRGAMTEMTQAFTASTGAPMTSTYGASGLLRERIEQGEIVDVFASADMGNPQALAKAGRAKPPRVFARNTLCALLAPGVNGDTNDLLDRLLDPTVKVGTSTPKSDPSGDYAWQLFEKAEKIRRGAFETLDAKALKLTGGANSPAPPPDRSIYAVLIAARKADIFLTYCTNALQAVREVPGARLVEVPDALTVGADYGLSIIGNASPAADRFAAYVMSPQGQAILSRHGFTAVHR